MSRTSNEFERIERFFAPLTEGFPGAFGLSDDAAVVTPPAGRDLVVTTDTIVAGVHFKGDEPPRLIAAKLLRVNLSDLASMGAAPLAYTLNIALPDTIDDDWLEDFADGLRADQEAFGIALAGGDSVSTPGALTLTVTAFGLVATGGALRRSGARPGDAVWVSGTIGDAALGLAALRGELAGLDAAAREALVERYRRPDPRVELGCRLHGLANAAIDISDGLAADLGHIAGTSGVAATLESSRIPLSSAARAALAADRELLSAVLTGGDDYELLFTAPPGAEEKIAALSAGIGLPLTTVGRIDAGAGVRVLGATGQEIALDGKGWVHGGG